MKLRFGVMLAALAAPTALLAAPGDMSVAAFLGKAATIVFVTGAVDERRHAGRESFFV